MGIWSNSLVYYDSKHNKIIIARVDDSMLRTFRADVTAACRQYFLFAVTDCLARAGQDIVYIIAAELCVHTYGATLVKSAQDSSPIIIGIHTG